MPCVRIWRAESIRDLIHSSRDFQFLVGHFPFGIHWLFRPRTAVASRNRVYFSVARDPIDQMVSLYRYYCHMGLYAESHERPFCVSKFIKKNRFENMQSRAHAGLFWWYPRSPLFLISKWLPDALLRRAKFSILRNYSYFLLQSHLDEQLPALASELGLSYRKVDEPSTHTDRERFMKTMDSEEREELTKLAQADVGLFDWISNNVARNGIAVRNWDE